MEYLDFSSVITTIRKYISEAHNINQIDLMYDLFVSFLSDESSMDFTFDNGLVCRWFNGQAKISPRITGYYMDRHQRNRLAADMHRNVLPLMYDSAMAVQEVFNILVQDTTISDKAKNQLLQNYPCATEMDEAIFLTSALCFGMERTFVKRDANTKLLLSTGNLSPVVQDFIYDSGVPKLSVISADEIMNWQHCISCCATMEKCSFRALRVSEKVNLQKPTQNSSKKNIPMFFT